MNEEELKNNATEEPLDKDAAVTTESASSGAAAESAAPIAPEEVRESAESESAEVPEETVETTDPEKPAAEIEAVSEFPKAPAEVAVEPVKAPIAPPPVSPYNLPPVNARNEAPARSPYESEAFQPRYAAPPQQHFSPVQPQQQFSPVQPQQQFSPVQPQLQFQPQPQIAPQNGAVVKKDKTGTAAIVIAFIIILVLMVAVALFYMIQGGDIELPQFGDKPAVSDSVDGGTVIQLPTESKPQVEEKYKEADGRYTPQGIAKVVAPSVVGIVTYEQGQNLVAYAEGTGFIISTDGYILSCAHIFEGAAKQKVILDDDTEFIATIVGLDIKSDLAVLKIDSNGKELQTATLGDSSELELGEEVIAIGNAGGFSNSISGGMVSGLDRKIKTAEDTLEMNCVQTDAAVNPGNSGGPLVNMYGQVVGIVSSKYTPSELYENIGFAITINDALPIATDIISDGYVKGRARVGVVYQGISDVSAKMMGVVPGLYIVGIDPTCDVANTDLALNDIITELNGKEVYDIDSTKEALEGLKPGDTVTAHVYRKDIVIEPIEFDITFKLMEDTGGY